MTDTNTTLNEGRGAPFGEPIETESCNTSTPHQTTETAQFEMEDFDIDDLLVADRIGGPGLFLLARSDENWVMLSESDVVQLRDWLTRWITA